MRIADLFRQKRPTLSFEVFPPKADVPVDTVYETLAKLSGLSPDYISVTYGAGGSNSSRMIEIASAVQNTFKQCALAHFTCVGASPVSVDVQLEAIKNAGIENILALRGDIPAGMERRDAFVHFRHASDLVEYIARKDGFCIGVAVYPEIHYESENRRSDITFLKKKVDAGADFMVTQMFFDNRAFFEFREIIAKAGIRLPLVTGIMPVLDASQILRMTRMSGCSIPAGLSRLFARYANDPEGLREVGLDYACEQVSELVKEGVDGIHLYSMNKWEATTHIVQACGLR
ncbi:MAG: methylenetetrahydrofolate reductase [NAD(P)H] [Bacillota bacterium]